MGKKKAHPRLETLEDDLVDSSQNQPKFRPRLPRTPFRFLDLPSEIRLQVYHFVLFTPTRHSARKNRGTVGASAKKSKPVAPTSHRINLFLVSRRIYDEASHYFYSTQIFRVFPVQDFSRMPTLRDLPPRHRSSVSVIELVLGSSWTAPPRSWTVNQSLGLHDLKVLRTLKVFVGCDPSQPVFEGFRISKEYYTEFSGRLMRQILERLPDLKWVEFDAYPSVSKKGSLMTRLLKECRNANKEVHWGPDRGWTDIDHDYDDLPEEPVNQAVVSAPKPDAVDRLADEVHDIRLRA